MPSYIYYIKTEHGCWVEVTQDIYDMYTGLKRKYER